MCALLPLLLAAAPAPAVEAEAAVRPRGGVVAVMRVQAEILRAERARPRPAPGGLERQVTRRADGHMQVEFE